MERKRLSPEEIRQQFFGTKQSALFHAEAVATKKQENDLTASAKFVVREARKRLSEQAVTGKNSSIDEEDLFCLVQSVEESEAEELSDKERHAVVAALSASLEHYDILTPLIENPEINDIIIRSYRDISVQSGRTNIQTDLSFPDQATYKAFVENLLKRAGKACTMATPVVDAAVDPYIRACVTHESFSPPGSGPMLTLRIARHRQISIDALVHYEMAPRLILDYLAVLIREARATLLVAGEVGSGKTTLIKALASEITNEEAILIIEDTHELVLKRPFVRTLLTREANTEGVGRISPAQAIRTGMRMAMNRIILGEMRDAEAAEAFIDVCASGHAGMSTIHARSARDAISRLELFLARAQGNVTIDTIRRQIANALSVVVYLDLDRKNRKRRVFEVLEVGTSADGTVQVSPIFSYLPQSDFPQWRAEGGISYFHDLLEREAIRIPLPGECLSLDPEALYSTHVRQNSKVCGGNGAYQGVRYGS